MRIALPILRVIIFLVPGLFAAAQNLSLKLQVHDHPPKSLAEWVERMDVMSLVLDNEGQNPASIKIRTIIKHDSQLVAYTRYNDVALVNVEQGSTTIPAASLLAPDAMEYMSGMGRCFVKSGTLSPGNYSVCCEVLDPLNPDVVLKCSAVQRFSIGGFDPVQLTEPVDYYWATRDKPLLFKWKAVHPSPQVPRIVRYKFLLFECAKGMDPNYVIETMEPVFEKVSDSVNPLSLVVPLNKIGLKTDRQYVWTVKAYDQDDRPYGDPDGMAEPFIFRVK